MAKPGSPIFKCSRRHEVFQVVVRIWCFDYIVFGLNLVVCGVCMLHVLSKKKSVNVKCLFVLG